MKERLKRFGAGFIKNGFIYTLLCLIVGVILTIWTDRAFSSIVIAILSCVTICGIVNVIKYFIVDSVIASEGLYLIKGLVMLESSAIFCLQHYLNIGLEKMVFISCLAILSSVRFQGALDMARKKYRIWYFFFAVTIILVLLSGLPFILHIEGTSIYRIIGITFLFECVDDFITRLILKTVD